MEMIFDTQGTGFQKRGVRQMMVPSKVPFVSGLSGGSGLGDEIMLLDGLDAAYPHGYSDGPAATYTMPTGDPATEYNFDEEVDLRGFSMGSLGAPVQRSAWGQAAGKNAYAYTGLGRTDYKYTGLGAARGWPQGRRGRYDYTGLDGLGTLSRDGALAESLARTALSICNAACGAAPLAQQVGCRSGCQIAFDAAMIPINAAYTVDPATGTAPPLSPMTADAIRAKLDRISPGTGSDLPAPPAAEGISTNTLLIGGIVIAGLIGAYVILK